MRPFLLSLCGILLLAGCSTPKLFWAEESYPNGATKVSYSYYLDRHGDKVPHGNRFEYPPQFYRTNEVTVCKYDHGRLIEGPAHLILIPNYAPPDPTPPASPNHALQRTEAGH